MTFTQKAQKQKKEVVGLESVNEQMAVFDSIPYQLQAKMLVASIKEAPKARAEFVQMVDLYKKQDLEGLLKITDSSEFDFDGYESILLTDRNKHWIEKIKKMTKAKPSFIAVGAAHLGGKDGIIALLRKQGYKVRAVVN